jgi:hypothetical protein
MILLEYPDNAKPLMNFCNGKSVTYKEFPKDPDFKLMAERLRPLLLESSAAEAEERQRLDFELEYDQNQLQLWKMDYFVGENGRVSVAIKKAMQRRDGEFKTDNDLTFVQRMKLAVEDALWRKNPDLWEMFGKEKFSKPKPWWEEQSTSDSNPGDFGYGLGWRGDYLHGAVGRELTDIDQAFRTGREKLKLVSDDKHFFFCVQ